MTSSALDQLWLLQPQQLVMRGQLRFFSFYDILSYRTYKVATEGMFSHLSACLLTGILDNYRSNFVKILCYGWT